MLNDGGKSEPYDWSTHPFEDDPDFQEEFDSTVNNPEVKEADELFTLDTYNQYLQMELAVPQGDSLEPRLAKVTKSTQGCQWYTNWDSRPESTIGHSNV